MSIYLPFLLDERFAYPIWDAADIFSYGHVIQHEHG
jgi:hypothetical protein